MPTTASNIVTVFGGSGFVGRYIVRRLAKKGYRVRVAVRRVNEAMFVRPYGAPGQIEPVLCNVRDDASVRAVTAGTAAVVYCVGVLDDVGKNTMEAIHADGAERVARIAAEEGTARMVLLSAIGADEGSDSVYAQTKGRGEAAVLAHMPGAMIVRPSVIFGAGDEFFNRFAGMTNFGPVLPIVGGDTMFQPVYVDDVAAAAVIGVQGNARGVFELGGPEVQSLRGLMDKMLDVIQRRRLVLNIPFPVARLMAKMFRAGRFLSFGLVPGPFSPDQVVMLGHDNVAAPDARGFADLGIAPADMDAVLPDYLWRFRPSGQYAAIKDSAKNLRKI